MRGLSDRGRRAGRWLFTGPPGVAGAGRIHLYIKGFT